VRSRIRLKSSAAKKKTWNRKEEHRGESLAEGESERFNSGGGENPHSWHLDFNEVREVCVGEGGGVGREIVTNSVNGGRKMRVDKHSKHSRSLEGAVPPWKER